MPAHVQMTKQRTWDKLDPKPPGDGHEAMMEDVQKTHLVRFLSQNKEYL